MCPHCQKLVAEIVAILQELPELSGCGLLAIIVWGGVVCTTPFCWHCQDDPANTTMASRQICFQSILGLEARPFPALAETAARTRGGAISDAAARTTIGEAISSSHNGHFGTACCWGLGLVEQSFWVLAGGMCAVTQADA